MSFQKMITNNVHTPGSISWISCQITDSVLRRIITSPHAETKDTEFRLWAFL